MGDRNQIAPVKASTKPVGNDGAPALYEEQRDATFNDLCKVMDILNFEAENLTELSNILAMVPETNGASCMSLHALDMLSNTLRMSAERIGWASDVVDRIPLKAAMALGQPEQP